MELLLAGQEVYLTRTDTYWSTEGISSLKPFKAVVEHNMLESGHASELPAAWACSELLHRSHVTGVLPSAMLLKYIWRTTLAKLNHCSSKAIE